MAVNEPHSEDAPKLAFLTPEKDGQGMTIHEVNLSPLGASLAPFKASRFTVEPNSTSAVDSHAVHEIWIIVEGEGDLFYDNRRVRLCPRDIVYFEPHKSHQVRNDGPCLFVAFSVWWKDESGR